ncbi:MAG: MFS transporter [Bacteroidetes bacterium]|nr:MAG: MFS transporter [Bacteroidota bacterium]
MLKENDSGKSTGAEAADSISPHPRTRPIRALVFLFMANIISGFAQGITMLAIPWYLVSELSNGKFINSAMAGSVTLLSLFWGLYAGTLVDRYNRKRIFQLLTILDACILVSAGLLSLYMGYVPIVLIVLVYATTIFTYNVHYPNLYAFVQELFERKYYAKVNSAIEVQGQTTNFIGMMLGGLLLSGSAGISWWPGALSFESWHLQEVFLLDGSTYVLGFVLISLIPYRPSPKKRIDTGAVWTRIQQGFAYLWARRPLMLFGICSHLMFFSLIVIVHVVMPIYVSDYLQEEAYILASFKGLYALGAVMAGVIGLSPFVKRNHLIKQIIALMLLGSALYFVCATTRSVRITLLAAVLFGIANAGIRILRITYIVRIVPNHVIGRVNSFFGVVNVLTRVMFIYLLTIPFFAAPDNGGNIVYAMALLGIILAGGALALLLRFGSFDQQAAVE